MARAIPRYKDGDERLSPNYKHSLNRDGKAMYRGADASGQRVVAIRIEEDIYDANGNLVQLGDQNEVSVPHLPYIKMITASGNVVNAPLNTNRYPNDAFPKSADPHYRSNVLNRHFSNGGFPYNYSHAQKYAALLAHYGVQVPDTEERWNQWRDLKLKELRGRHETRQKRDEAKAMREVLPKDTAQEFAAAIVDALKNASSGEEKPKRSRKKDAADE